MVESPWLYFGKAIKLDAAPTMASAAADHARHPMLLGLRAGVTSEVVD